MVYQSQFLALSVLYMRKFCLMSFNELSVLKEWTIVTVFLLRNHLFQTHLLFDCILRRCHDCYDAVVLNSEAVDHYLLFATTNLIFFVVHFYLLQFMVLSALWKYLQISLFLGKTFN